MTDKRVMYEGNRCVNCKHCVWVEPFRGGRPPFRYRVQLPIAFRAELRVGFVPGIVIGFPTKLLVGIATVSRSPSTGFLNKGGESEKWMSVTSRRRSTGPVEENSVRLFDLWAIDPNGARGSNLVKF